MISPCLDFRARALYGLGGLGNEGLGDEELINVLNQGCFFGVVCNVYDSVTALHFLVINV